MAAPVPRRFITLAGRGHTSQGETKCFLRGGPCGRARKMASCTHPSPPEQGERGQVDQIGAHDKSVILHHARNACPETSPDRKTLHVRMPHEPVPKMG